MYPAEDDANGEDDSIYDGAKYIARLHNLTREFINRDHLDLAVQALSEANFLENSWRDSPDQSLFSSTLHRYLSGDYEMYGEHFGGRVTQVLDKPVYFVLDFDHTLAKTNIAHENLRRAIYAALPQEMPYDDFMAKFDDAYS